MLARPAARGKLERGGRAPAPTPSSARGLRPARPVAAAAAPSAAPPAQNNNNNDAGDGAFAAFERLIIAAQDRILREAEALDGSGRAFLRDRWERSGVGAGYGVTAVLEGGDLLEKAAANVTVIRGTLSPQRAQAMSSRGRASVDPRGGQRYGAAALSLVFHPRHPRVPTLRADVRLFQVFPSCDGGNSDGKGQDAAAASASAPPPLSWYGGGCDLTPALLFEEDAREFHAHWRDVCGAHHPSLYPELKPWCDRYFYVTARREHRGVGGIFFDDLEQGGAGGAAVAGGAARGAGDGKGAAAGGDNSSSKGRQPRGGGEAAGEGAPRSMAAARAGQFDPAALARDVIDNVLPSWRLIAERRRAEPSTDAERAWQLQWRGRYLEFNLLDDRGVRFGLADGSGRVESIMVSAPPLVAWSYNVVPPEGSREAATLELLRGAPIEWV